jgi:hypothetical protein
LFMVSSKMYLVEERGRIEYPQAEGVSSAQEEN